jgi:SAM-dependent methyltransferase
MNLTVINEVAKFLTDTFTCVESVADFGGGGGKRGKMKRIMARRYRIPLDVYDLEDGFDLTKQRVTKIYQLIFCMDMLEHTPEPKKVIENLEQALEPGGYAFIAAPKIWRKHGLDYNRFSYNDLVNLWSNWLNIRIIKAYELPIGEFIESFVIVQKYE